MIEYVIVIIFIIVLIFKQSEHYSSMKKHYTLNRHSASNPGETNYSTIVPQYNNNRKLTWHQWFTNTTPVPTDADRALAAANVAAIAKARQAIIDRENCRIAIHNQHGSYEQAIEFCP